MNRDTQLKRLRFRAWHRGTKEADLLIGGFCDRHASGFDDDGLLLLEMLLDEDDVDIMAWAIGTAPLPTRYQGPMGQALTELDYISHAC